MQRRTTRQQTAAAKNIAHVPANTSAPAPAPASTPQINHSATALRTEELFPLLLDSRDNVKQHVSSPSTSRRTSYAQQAASSSPHTPPDSSPALGEDDNGDVDIYMLRWGQAILAFSVTAFILGTHSMLLGPLLGDTGLSVNPFSLLYSVGLGLHELIIGVCSYLISLVATRITSIWPSILFP